MKIRSNSSKLNIELIDKVNPVKSRYRQRPIFDLIDFYNSKEEGYFYLTVVTIGDRNGASILVYQIDGPSVTLEKVSDYIYKYKDPEDEIYTERLFEVEVIIDNTDSKKKQTKVISDPSVYYLTSQIYPINLVEEAYTSSKGITGRILTTNDLRLYQSIFEDGFTSLSKITGIFKQSLFLYDYKNEDNNTFDPVKTSINRLVVLFRELLKVYVVPIDNSKISISRINGVMKQLLIQYNFYIPEILKSNVNKVEASSFYFNPYHEIFINGNTTDYNPNDSDNGVTIIQKSTNQKIVNNLNDKGISYKTYNTSVLDFENGLVDRVNSGITWNKAGTADINTTNKLYSTSSFETKDLGDSLYTSSTLITGGSTPYTIEFDALVKGSSKNVSGYDLFKYPLIAKNNNSSSGEQVFSLDNNMFPVILRNTALGQSMAGQLGYTKVKLNEINRHTISYDGSVIRWFIDNKLSGTLGTSKGFENSASTPFTFFRNSIPTYSVHDTNTHGLIDNIVISDNIATKIRDIDVNEGSLIVDLSFDGENNSTLIKDNGVTGITWNLSGSAKLSTDQSFGSYSSLKLDGTSGSCLKTQTAFDDSFITTGGDYTISFSFILASTIPSGERRVLFSTRNDMGGFADGFCLYIKSDRLEYFGWSGTGVENFNYQIVNSFSSNTPYDVLISRTKNEIGFYINNNLIYLTNQVQNHHSSNFQLYIGTEQYADNSNVSSRNLNGYIKDFKVYKGVGVKPSQKITNYVDVNIASSVISSDLVWDTSNTVLNSNYFTGYLLNTSASNAFTFYGSDFILVYKFKGYGNLIREWNSNLRYRLTVNSNGSVSFDFYEAGPNLRNVTTNTQTLLSDNNELIIKRFNGYFLITLNGVAYTVTQSVTPFSGNIYAPTSEGVKVGDTTLTTYSLNIYKEITTSSESIQLNFDNNLLDTYRNSTWTNSGVTFNNTESVKGYAAYFNNTSIISTTNLPLNFSNQYLEFDFNPTVINTHNIIYANNYLLVYLRSNVIAFEYYNNGTYLGTNSFPLVCNINNYYNFKIHFKDKVYCYVNDSIVAVLNNYNYNYSNITSQIKFGMSMNNNYYYTGYLDNFISERNYISNLNRDRPTVQLPLETNSTNIGFNSLTITETGSPVYQTISSKKCIKFENGKYLSINSDDVFNLSTNSDFYIEFDSYISNTNNTYFISNQSATTLLGLINNKVVLNINSVSVFGNITPVINTWVTTKIYRKNNILTLDYNGTLFTTSSPNAFDLSSGSTTIGAGISGSNVTYMSNFKMLVGVSKLSETYNDKVVLDLDFSPTRNSYLFKDKGNKVVLHPVNITQRDYQNSKYCCTLNGTNQYLTLGKNTLFNFGNDDFGIRCDFSISSVGTSSQILIGNGSTDNTSRAYLGITGTSHSSPKKVVFGITNSSGTYYEIFSDSIITENNMYDVRIVSSNTVIKMFVNGIEQSQQITSGVPVNFNGYDNTFIGAKANPAEYVNGSIYCIKVLRNTNNINLLGESILYTTSNIYLPLSKDIVDIKGTSTWTNNSNQVIFENAAAKFDGNNSTYLTTNTVSNLNYGTNDFTIGVDSYKTGTQSEARLIGSNVTNATYYPRTEIKHSTNMGLCLSNYVNSAEIIYKTYKSADLINNWNRSKFTKTNNTLFTYINDSLVDVVTVPNGHQFNLNTNGGSMVGGVLHTTSNTYDYQGYIKNIYSNNSSDTTMMLPYMYFPFDTSLTDLGVNNIPIYNGSTINTTLTTLNDIKCTRINAVTTNLYVNIILGNIFTIKSKIFINTPASSGYVKPLFGTGYNSNIGFLLSQSTEPWSGNANPELWLRTSNGNIRFAINSLINTWIDIVIVKTLTSLTLNVNGADVGTLDSSAWVLNDFEINKAFYFGDGGTDWKQSSVFYIRDFKYYKGITSIPSTELISKKVLDLKFKKDDNQVYPFKDESNRHVVSYTNMDKYNLVNIEGIDCCQFNGINQYLELGNTKLLNLSNEDFIISFKIYLIPFTHTNSSQLQIIIASGGTSSVSNVSYIAYDQTTKSLIVRATDTEVYRISNVLKEYAWNTVIITRQADIFSSTINGNLNVGVISSTNNFNLNYNFNTYIGINKWNAFNEYFKGYLTDFKVLKGSSDISLIDVNINEAITIVNPPKAVYYPIKLNEIDSFCNLWSQTNATNPVRLKEYNKGLGTSMYFDGVSGLQSSNTFNRIGLNKFTIECSILIDSAINATYPMTICSYGISYNISTWFSLEVTSNGVIRFCTDKAGLIYVSSPVNTINYNTKYDIAVTRDENYNLRIFVNGIMVANEVSNICFDNYSQNNGVSYQVQSNNLIIGKRGEFYNNTNPTLGGFRGNIENFHFLVGTCKYTSNYTPTIDDTIKLDTVSLLNVSDTTGTNPSTITDTKNRITYTNTGCTIESLSNQLRPYSIRCQTVSNRLISSVDESMFNLSTLNWTIDLIFRPMQTSAEAYLLDTRANSTIFKGLVIRQPQTNPTTIMIEIGSSSASSAFENTYQTSANTLVSNTTYHLRIVRCREMIYIFINGTLLTSINYGLKDIGYSNKILLFNNDLFTKGFNGYVTQFRFIKGISTNIFAFPQLTQELK